MKTTTLAAALLAVPLLAACNTDAGTQTTVLNTSVVTPEDACGASAYQQYVGQQSPQISVPAGTAMRHYRTGDPMTMDMRIDRLNFEYDRSGRLVAVTCG